jgi:hypothetical protein
LKYRYPKQHKQDETHEGRYDDPRYSEKQALAAHWRILTCGSG